jgi:hypothetical protein
MNIYFATWLEGNQGVTLTIAQAQKRLMSYFFLKDVEDKDAFFDSYINHGTTPRHKDEVK